ncbi:MAG: hypothetical protein IJZ85_08430 [Lachnospiraceae bacterium]|nr:hypothetical protein [Lachnospiraceae bacterium]
MKRMVKHKGKILMITGAFCLIISFAWMIWEQSSTGGFLMLAAVAGGLIANGIVKQKEERNTRK